ncbi:MAG: PilZ domain-containing protein [Planctomycetes bacterium]|nr:PilZ domain-containing protein [Planctomycetota bacterium]
MSSADYSSMLPLAATMDLQYRLPPFQQIFFSPTIGVSLGLLLIVIALVIYLSRKAKDKAKLAARFDALKTAERILMKRGASPDDAAKILYAFNANPALDPAAIIMIRDRFQRDFRPILDNLFGEEFGQRLELVYYPPPKDTQRNIGVQSQNVQALVEEKKKETGGLTPAAIIDLMDATLRPGIQTRLVFSGQEGGYLCIVMGHDMQFIDVTLPANNDSLVAALTAGTEIKGSLESGPSLLAFTSEVVQAVAGRMPHCRIAAWKSAWEIRTRESVRLPITLDIDFQHISVSTGSIKMSNLSKTIGAVRPGRLVDISLGGCCISTQSDAAFKVGDLIRFSQSLAEGTPPPTILGSVINCEALDPEKNHQERQRLRIQFLAMDDVSQRILARVIRQLNETAEMGEWLQAQKLIQQMRRNNVPILGSPNAKSRLDSSPTPHSDEKRKSSSQRKTRTTRIEPRRSIMPKPGQEPAKRKLSS